MNDRFDNFIDTINATLKKHADWTNEQLKIRDTMISSLLKTVMDGFNELKEENARLASDVKCLEVQIQDMNTRFQDLDSALSALADRVNEKQDRPWRELR
jgi:hypothetical protein